MVWVNASWAFLEETTQGKVPKEFRKTKTKKFWFKGSYLLFQNQLLKLLSITSNTELGASEDSSCWILNMANVLKVS